VDRRLVREALTRAELALRKKLERRSPKLEPFKKIVNEWLIADWDASRTRRHTVKQIYTRLIAEYDATDISYSALRVYMALYALLQCCLGRCFATLGAYEGIPRRHSP
jgi:hypothetical protein